MGITKNAIEQGFVYWITGLSGAGKTAIGNLFYDYLKRSNPNSVHLDGDVLRQIFGGKNGYTLKERKMLAMQYSRLCRMLSEQGIHVVCTTISMFHEVCDWNRSNIQRYIEVYVKAPLKVLIQRDQKGLYRKAQKGEIKNVMGVDLEYEEPCNPDILLLNNGVKSPKEMVKILIIATESHRRGLSI
jgi:adenylyl-sulfate kinase